MSNPERPFGWRKRIGLLSPTVIETAAYDFYRLAPDGVSMCATTSNIEHWAIGQSLGRHKTAGGSKGLAIAGFSPYTSNATGARAGRRLPQQPAQDLPSGGFR
jgi:hypothetical protein